MLRQISKVTKKTAYVIIPAPVRVVRCIVSRQVSQNSLDKDWMHIVSTDHLNVLWVGSLWCATSELRGQVWGGSFGKQVTPGSVDETVQQVLYCDSIHFENCASFCGLIENRFRIEKCALFSVH